MEPRALQRMERELPALPRWSARMKRGRGSQACASPLGEHYCYTTTRSITYHFIITYCVLEMAPSTLNAQPPFSLTMSS